MKELVDLYAKLVIGMFTFIGPSFTLLISLFYRQLVRLKKRNKERTQILAGLDDTKALRKQIFKNDRDNNFLNPKRQVVRLFISLLSALVGIGFYYFQHTHFWLNKSQSIRIVTIVASLIAFVYSLIVLWQVFCIIIDAKKDEASDGQSETILQTLNVPS